MVIIKYENFDQYFFVFMEIVQRNIKERDMHQYKYRAYG